MKALRTRRPFLGRRAYWDSLIPQGRNTIGSHYDERAVAEVVRTSSTDALAALRHGREQRVIRR